MGITADTALRLERLLDATAAFWLGLQVDFDTETARAGLAATLGSIVPVP